MKMTDGTYNLSTKRLERLMSRLCVKYGFCDCGDYDALLACTDAAALVDAVIRAEGLEPWQVDLHLYRKMKADALEMFFRE